jgi:hypothetical protein
MGVTEIGIIRDAVRAFIERRISNDDDLRQRYETIREQLRMTRHQPIRLVKSDGDANGNG